MTRSFVRRWSLFLLPTLAACGLTDLLEPDVPDEEPVVQEFEDAVASVDLVENSVTLHDGSVVRVVDGTEHRPDDQGRTHTLAEVHEALEAQLPVNAWGKGEVEQEEPLRLEATRLGFAIERPVREFEDVVVSVNLDAGSFCLADGTTVRMADHTELKPDENGERHELPAVREALEAGRRVVAWGAGEHGDDEMSLVALRVGFAIEEPAVVEFQGDVTQVLMDNGKFQLADGTFVRVKDHTQMHDEDGSPVTLAQMKEALEAGSGVFAWGSGQVEGQEPLVLDGLEVTVAITATDPDPELTPFEGQVDFVDTGDAAVFLVNGLEIVVVGETVVSGADEFSPASMDALVEALESGRRVTARGAGTVDEQDANRIVAANVEFEVVMVEFDADVSMVDYGGGLILDNGSFILLTEGTTITAADENSPSDLTGVDEALANGDGVRATGFGYFIGGGEDGEPVSAEAVEVTLLLLPNG